MRTLVRTLLIASGATAAILTATFLEYRLRLNLATAESVQLLLVFAIALRAGLPQAMLASVLAFVCLDYFFTPPLFSFAIASPRDWAALIVFEAAALLVSRLSTEARQQERRAREREGELTRLYDLSRRLLFVSLEKNPGPRIAELIQTTFGLEEVLLYDAAEEEAYRAGTATAQIEQDARGAFNRDSDHQSRETNTRVSIVRTGVRAGGSLALRGSPLSSATNAALTSLISLVLQVSKALADQTRAEAERQSEQLRTAVVDALAHDYKTPLTVIRTATSGLLKLGSLSNNQFELVTLVDNEVTRLSDLTTSLLQMSRLDRTDLRLHPEPVDADELVESVLSKMRRALCTHEIRVRPSGGQAIMHADLQLTSMALTQLLDNAVKYSTAGSQITVSIDLLPREVRIAVHNVGSCIPPEERDRIFQRFYRSPAVRFRANGTGIGLSITRKIAELHKGRVAVSSNNQTGTTFSLSLLRRDSGVVND